jgi:hypothetical protein
MTLNPSNLSFNAQDTLISQPRSWNKPTSTVPNEIFAGVLKLHYFCNGSNGADVQIEIVKGPPGLVGKKAEISARHVNEAMANNTLLSDALGYYLEGTWVFAKRGAVVRLIEYKA